MRSDNSIMNNISILVQQNAHLIPCSPAIPLLLQMDTSNLYAKAELKIRLGAYSLYAYQQTMCMPAEEELLFRKK